jgi:hypothetical protein
MGRGHSSRNDREGLSASHEGGSDGDGTDHPNISEDFSGGRLIPPPSSEALQAIGLGRGENRHTGIGHTAGFQTAQQQSALDLG